MRSYGPNYSSSVSCIGPRPIIMHRARKLYTSARIYEWKFGKGEWKLPFASSTGRVDFFGFVIIFEEKQRKHSEERSFGRFKMSLKVTGCLH